MNNIEFIRAVSQGAIEGWKLGRILPSVSIAQAILESFYGQSELATQAHNLFGIKAGKEWNGEVYQALTKEWDSNANAYISIMADFRSYADWNDSIKDHSLFFSTPSWRKDRYKDVIGETDYILAANALKSAGYATDPGYPAKLIGIVERYNLTEYDKQISSNNNRSDDVMTQAVGSTGAYEYITSYDSGNYNGSASIDAIVVHHWGIDGQNFDNICGWLCNPNQPSGREGSAHYVLEDGKVACLIAPGLRAWHVRGNDYQQVMQGVYDINSCTIGIECRPECTEGDRETLAALIADLWRDYGVIPVYYHRQFMSTDCAGRYIPYMENGWLEARAKEYYNGQVNTNTTEEETEMRKEVVEWLEGLYDKAHSTECSEWAKKEIEEAVTAKITTGERPQDLMTREEGAAMIMRALNNIKVP